MIFLSFTIQVQGVFEQLLYRKGNCIIADLVAQSLKRSLLLAGGSMKILNKHFEILYLADSGKNLWKNKNFSDKFPDPYI
jgi:hypothetical protein